MEDVIHKYYMLLRSAKQLEDWESKRIYQKAINQLERHFPESYKKVRQRIFGV